MPKSPKTTSRCDVASVSLCGACQSPTLLPLSSCWGCFSATVPQCVKVVQSTCQWSGTSGHPHWHEQSKLCISTEDSPLHWPRRATAFISNIKIAKINYCKQSKSYNSGHEQASKCCLWRNLLTMWTILVFIALKDILKIFWRKKYFYVESLFRWFLLWTRAPLSWAWKR